MSQSKMDIETRSITSTVTTAATAVALVLFMMFVAIMILMLVVISDTIELNNSLNQVQHIASVITNKYGWLIDNSTL